MELSVRYSQLVDTKTRASLVLKDGVIFNNRYEGDAKAGAVKVRKSGAAVIADYDKVNGIAQTSGASQYITITIDKDKAVNEIVDGYEAAAVPDGIVADRLDEAGYGMALKLDTDGATELVTGGTKIADTTALTKSNVYSKIVDVRTALTKAGVPNTGRYIIVSPDVFAYILKSDEFTPASGLGDAVKETGALGSIAGFAVYESNNLGTVTEGEGNNATTYTVEFVAGHPGYATRVNEWAVPISVKDCNDGKHIGATSIQGRKVYAHKVTNSAAILVKRTAA